MNNRYFLIRILDQNSLSKDSYSIRKNESILLKRKQQISLYFND